MIVADTGAIVALIDADDDQHHTFRKLFEDDPEEWVLPWAILPEVDYLVMSHVGARAELAFLEDLAGGTYVIEGGQERDVERAHELCMRHRDLKLGLVDSSVIAVAERLKARAIATLDVRYFGAVAIRGRPKLLPRDTA